MLCTVFMLAAAALTDARVHRRVKEDGSIEFYNSADGNRDKGRASLMSKYDSLIDRISADERVDPNLIKCIVKVESGFNPDAVSVAGAMGLMQLTQDTARFYGLKDPFDPETNLTAGTRHFKVLLDFFKNDIPLALAAYHAGLGRVKSKMAIPPIQSTIDYVNSVMFLYEGKKNFGARVVKLYKKIERDGTILIYSK